ncbi:DUF3592 domain-containing protein [Mucilaginibacter psychrotolerans]|uniref:DUF3592 domain-containing protein n=1 Tax=Mucilaginibacter psychrotolerans TaxID=1524096 RepID=A0A4Y8SDX7_9SPHI|nr:DUF3592 domain-containing protein [Mucilaginibacter psychrotolerans]TFF37303.1 DUF3592 domain-containing protein [Mucilaginibacter psychrotolerans]
MINLDISDRTYCELFGAIAGLFVLVYGNGKRVQFNKLLKNGIRVQGKVEEIKIKRWSWITNNRQATFYPVIYFKTIDSGPISADYDLFASNPSAYSLGEKVEVVYDPTNPRNFMVDNLSSKMVAPLLLLAGAAVLFASVIFYILDPDSYIRF